LERVAAIPAKNGSPVDGHKNRMREVILQGREDLHDRLSADGGKFSDSGRKPTT